MRGRGRSGSWATAGALTALVGLGVLTGCAAGSVATTTSGSTPASATTRSTTSATTSPPPSGPILDFRATATAGFVLGSAHAATSGEGQQDFGTTTDADIGTIQLTDPSIFDRMPLVSKQLITVGGHHAYYAEQRQELVSNGPGPVSGTAGTLPVVTWQVSAQRWLIVSPTLYGSATDPDLSAWGTDIRTKLLGIATGVDTDETTVLTVPFRLTGPGGGLTVTQADSNPGSRAPGGDVSLSDGTRLISISAVKPVMYTPDTSGTAVTVGTYSGFVGPDCGVAPGPSGAPGSVPTQSDCMLTVRIGPWQVILTAQARGASVTESAMIALAGRLSLASDPNDSGTWDDARDVVG